MRFHKLYKPNKEFRERTRAAFLAAFREKFPAGRSVVSPAFAYFMRGLAAGVAGVVVFMSASVYADQTNVGPDNFLYPLKRSQEWLNLTLTDAAERPALHLKLAERRLGEIQSVREDHPQSQRIVGLTAELRDEVQRSLPTIENFDVEEVKAIKGGAVETSSSSDRGVTEPIRKKSSGEENKPAASEQIGVPAVVPSEGGSAVPSVKRGDRGSRDIREVPEPVRSRVDDPPSDIYKEIQATTRGKSGDSGSSSNENKRVLICQSWKNLLESELEEVHEVVAEHPNFSQSLRERCPLPGD